MADTCDAKCHECGTELVKNARFCMECGAPVTKPSVESKLLCRLCKEPIESNTKFCSNCGEKVQLESDNKPQIAEENKTTARTTLDIKKPESKDSKTAATTTDDVKKAESNELVKPSSDSSATVNQGSDTDTPHSDIKRVDKNNITAEHIYSDNDKPDSEYEDGDYVYDSAEEYITAQPSTEYLSQQHPTSDSQKSSGRPRKR